MRTNLNIFSKENVRMAMLFGVFVSFILIAIATMSIHSPLTMPGGMSYVFEAAVPLLVYGLISFWIPALGLMHRGSTLQTGTSVGIFVGILQIMHMALENFGLRIGENAAITLGFMLSGFALWGMAGYRVTRKNGDIKTGVAASCWSAMVSVLMAVTFGLVLMTFNFPPSSYVSTWSEFGQSGWTDARAFAVANSFDSVFGHLIVGPIAGAIFGFFGAAIAKVISDFGANPERRVDRASP
jgi:hypothetical protein